MKNVIKIETGRLELLKKMPIIISFDVKNVENFFKQEPAAKNRKRLFLETSSRKMRIFLYRRKRNDVRTEEVRRRLSNYYYNGQRRRRGR